MKKEAKNLIGLGIIVLLLTIFCMVLIQEENHRTETKIFQIEANPYDVNINIIITQDTTLALKFAKLNTDSTVTIEDFRGAASVSLTGDGIPTIWFPSLTRSTRDIAKANHELMHMLFYITNRAGLSLNESTDEAFAYELDYLTLQLYKHIK